MWQGMVAVPEMRTGMSYFVRRRVPAIKHDPGYAHRMRSEKKAWILYWLKREPKIP